MTTATYLPPSSQFEDEEAPLEPLCEAQPRPHIPALDAVRGLAILAVTLYRFHAGPVDHSILGRIVFPALNLGARGVDLFFVLSGFLITGILCDTKDDRHFFRNFYLRRALRIFPLYYGALFLALIVFPVMSTSPSPWASAEINQAWLWLYGTNLLISLRGEWCLGSFDHFWSLAVEEHFYFVWPLVIYACSRKAAIRISATLAIASAISRVAWLACGGNDAAADVLTCFRLDGLLVGAWLALVAREPQGMRILSRWAKPVAACSAVLLLPDVIWQRRLLTIPTAIYAVFFGALIIMAINAQSRWAKHFWNSRGLQMLGRYSYGMYVFQNPLIPLLSAYFTAESLAHAVDSPLWGRLIYIALMSGITLTVAIVSWHIYEKHFLKLKARF